MLLAGELLAHPGVDLVVDVLRHEARVLLTQGGQDQVTADPD